MKKDSKFARNGNTQNSFKLGKCKTYLTTIQRAKTKEARYKRALGRGDLLQGCIKYDEYANRLRAKVQDLYFEIENPVVVVKWLRDNEYFKSTATASTFFHHDIFKIGTMRVNVMYKMRMILREFESANK